MLKGLPIKKKKKPQNNASLKELQLCFIKEKIVYSGLVMQKFDGDCRERTKTRRKNPPLHKKF